MTTAHRPTFDPARGKEIQRGPAYHQRLLPAYTKLKVRQPGQGGDADKSEYRDLRAELLKAEAEHFAKAKGLKNGTAPLTEGPSSPESEGIIRRKLKSSAEWEQVDDGGISRSERDGENRNEPGDCGREDMGGDENSPEAKRRRILAETRDLDADSDGEEKASSDQSSDDDDDEDDEDETAELLRELEKIKRERAEAREREEREKAAQADDEKMVSIARGNPLLNPDAFSVKRRWDDDVIFKNQARGTDDRNKRKEFVNDLLRSDFHKKFMNKYVR